jgi:type IV pilus assembly protein PilW
MTQSLQRQPGSRDAPRGFTLVELLVSMTIGLLLVAGMLSALLGSSATGKTRDRAAAVQFSGRYALDVMKRDIQHAGYLGITSLFSPDEAVTTTIAGLVIANVCDPPGTANVGRISLRVWGAEANPYAGTCLPAAQYKGGDVIVVRRLASSPVPPTCLCITAIPPCNNTLIYYHSSYEGGQPFVGPTAPDFTATGRLPPYCDYQLQETVYYVSPYTTPPPNTESPPVPALYRLTLSNGPAMVPELVASGVEQMGIRYGVFATDGSAKYVPASGVSDWDNVASVEISLLVRADAAEPGYKNTATYALGAIDFTANDGYRRTIYTTVIQMRN